MSKRITKYQRAIELARQCSPEVILKAAARCDGHTIMKAQAFSEVGLPEEIVTLHTRTYASDGSPKGSIFVDGKTVNELSGVYGLDLLRFFASALGVEYQSAIGRGFEARNIQSALNTHFADNGSVKP